MPKRRNRWTIAAFGDVNGDGDSLRSMFLPQKWLTGWQWWKAKSYAHGSAEGRTYIVWLSTRKEAQAKVDEWMRENPDVKDLRFQVMGNADLETYFRRHAKCKVRSR